SRFFFFFFYASGRSRVLPSFPTRRSSDLSSFLAVNRHVRASARISHPPAIASRATFRSFASAGTLHRSARQLGHHRGDARRRAGDRKSTRLNSSHRTISYAVFCLKKKKNN